MLHRSPQSTESLSERVKKSSANMLGVKKHLNRVGDEVDRVRSEVNKNRNLLDSFAMEQVLFCKTVK